MRRTETSANVKTNAKAINQLNIVKSLNDTEIKNAIKWAMKTYLKVLIATSPLWIMAINYLMK